MVACFLAYERDHDTGRTRLWAPLLGLMCAWLQPWQGATVVTVLLGAEALLWCTERRTPLRLLATTVAATAVPLAYYAVLSRVSYRVVARRRCESIRPVAVVGPVHGRRTVAPLHGPGVPGSRTQLCGRCRASLASGDVRYLLVHLVHPVRHVPLHTVQGLSIPWPSWPWWVRAASDGREPRRRGPRLRFWRRLSSPCREPPAARNRPRRRAGGASALFAHRWRPRHGRLPREEAPRAGCSRRCISDKRCPP